MKVLFVLPPFRHGRDILPLGPAYITAMLLKNGHSVQVIDVDAFDYTREELISLFGKLRYDVVAIGGLATAYNFVRTTAEDVKRIRPDVKVIAGGYVVSPMPELVLKNSKVDIGVVGEGEVTIVELLRALEKGEGLNDVNGIAFKDKDKIVITRERELIKDLDSLPFPAWDNFYAEEIYTRTAVFKDFFRARRSINISTGRGCPYQCTFCSYDRRVRLRSADNIIYELKELKKRYNVGSFSIQDELFLVNRKRAVEFCNKILESKLNMTWVASGRVNLVDREILKLFKKAGCVMVGYGIESGSPKVIERMKKMITPEQVENAVRWTTEAGLIPGGSWILGMPGEDRDTVKETMALYKSINRYRNYSNRFFFATPFPGTALYDEMKEMGRIGDENEYMQKLSANKEASRFFINCTTVFSDEELVNLKKDMEGELRKDLRRKHRASHFFQTFLKISGLERINKLAVALKVQGPVFTMRKILCKLTGKSAYVKPYL